MTDSGPNAQPLTLTIIGFIWTGGDSFDVSLKNDSPAGFMRAHIPLLVEHARKVCIERGVSMGDLCDEMNREMEAKEREERQRQGIPSIEMTFTAPISPELWETLNWKRVE